MIKDITIVKEENLFWLYELTINNKALIENKVNEEYYNATIYALKRHIHYHQYIHGTVRTYLEHSKVFIKSCLFKTSDFIIQSN